MPTAYSYVRFSSPEQAKGDSLRRQLAASQQYADENGLTLDTRTFQDLGTSGFHGDNLTGKLGTFLSAIDAGEIKRGSYLLVESIDRLSRDQILKSLNLFTSILSKGIVIVTLSDNKEYTEDSINKLPDLIYSLMIMARAHEESALKGSRVAGAWANKRKRATTEGHKITARCPGWLTLNGDTFCVIEERAHLVQRMYQMCLDGYGAIAITKQLNEERIPTWHSSDGWHISYIQLILHNPAVYGEFTPGLINKTKLDPIPDYFPAIIPKDTFLATQHAIAQRTGKGGRPGTRINIFSALLRCAKCKGSLIRLNKGRHTIPVFACSNGLRNMSTCKYHPWAVEYVEAIILTHLQDLDVTSLFSHQESKLKSIRSQITAATIDISRVKQQLANVVEAIKREAIYQL